MVILGAITGGDDKGSDKTAVERNIPVPVAAEQSTSATTDEPVQTIDDARQAVDDDRYADATTIATAIERASLKAATARAVQRRQQRWVAAAQRRRAVAAAATAAAQPKPQSNRDPNYEGACLDPSSSDYDCSGGSGDGPDYTGPVRSVASDPFDLGP